jgi:hypothetical protein
MKEGGTRDLPPPDLKIIDTEGRRKCTKYEYQKSKVYSYKNILLS